MAPVGERRFLDGLARMMRSARRSKSPGVAQERAVKWERALACFIKVRLITEKLKAEMLKTEMGAQGCETTNDETTDHGRWTTRGKQKR